MGNHTIRAKLVDEFDVIFEPHTPDPNLRLVHCPIHSLWLNQVEIYLSIVDRKVLPPTISPTWARSSDACSTSSDATTRPPNSSSGSSPAVSSPSYSGASSSGPPEIRGRTYEPEQLVGSRKRDNSRSLFSRAPRDHSLRLTCTVCSGTPVLQRGEVHSDGPAMMTAALNEAALVDLKPEAGSIRHNQVAGVVIHRANRDIFHVQLWTSVI